MRVTVLYGGEGDEREVSLVSGRAVIAGLEAGGHSVFASDVAPGMLAGLDVATDVVFPVLHGGFGENGELQEILEQRGLAFVGSGSAASRLGMDKAAAKRAWERAGLPTPPWRLVERGAEGRADEIRLPCVVKAVAGGSSVDVYLCRTPGDREAALGRVIGRWGRALVERLIEGPELTVGLLEEAPLAPIRIVPRGEFFDYEAKYRSGETQHLFDTGLAARTVERCRELARQANAVVGARDLARVDIMLDADHAPYLLEINTLPGFTPRSLLPEAAAEAGIDFTALVDRLVRRAQRRRQAA